MTVSKQNGKKPEQIVRKQFLRGSVTDEHTLKSSLLFFGSLLVVFFMSFIISITISGAADVIRILVGTAIIAMVAIIYYNKGTVHGAEAVTRGEILFQKEEKDQTVSESEKKICYHPMKAFVTGLIGTIPLFLIALIFSLNTQIQTTSSGTLPSWMQAYLRRDDIAGPLVAYTQTPGMSLIDILRIIIRIAVMPFINLVGSSNYGAVYLIEKLSPLILLLPACAYGIGYLSGPNARARVHTAISANENRRKRRERKERRIRAGLSAKPKEPEKLN